MYTRLGSIISGLVLFFGVFKVGIGFWAVSQPTQASRNAVENAYLLGAPSGVAIDKGFYMIAIAVAFGILVEISRKLDSSSD